MTALSSRLRIAAFVAAALSAGLAPLWRSAGPQPVPAGGGDGFPGWPQAYENRPLSPLPLTAQEEAFTRDFPGRIGRFTDGSRDFIIRWVSEPTRRLHPASDCLRGAGFSLTPRPARRNGAGALMGCFDADKSEERLRVCEYVMSVGGRSWPDVSAWWWSALLTEDPRGWWSFVVAERR